MIITLNGISINDFSIQTVGELVRSKEFITEMEKYIEKSTGCGVSNQNLSQILLFVDESLPDEGIAIELNEKGVLSISGQCERALFYAMYEFWERYIGWRFYSFDDEHLLPCDKIELSPFSFTFEPKFKFRFSYTSGAFRDDIKRRQKGNFSVDNNTDPTVVKHTAIDGKWGHTFFKYVSPDEYFESHPEYFSMDEKGERIKNGQLCLTNENVYKIVEEKLIREATENPDIEFVSFSQNDWAGGCVCENCKKQTEQYQANIAPIIIFLNRIGKKFKELGIKTKLLTFSYHWTTAAPKGLEIEDNIYIWQATMNRCNEHSLTDPNCRWNGDMLKALFDWKALGVNTFLWTYVTSFQNYFVNLPKNVLFLYDDFQIYKKLNVQGLMVQNNGESRLHFAPLWGYLTARMSWDIDLTYSDYMQMIKEYLIFHYGEGWYEMLSYIYLYASLRVSDKCYNPYPTAQMAVPYFCFPDGQYDTYFFDSAYALLQKAEEKAETEEFKANVDQIRMCVDFLRLEVTHAARIETERESIIQEAKRLYEKIKKYNVTKMSEGKGVAAEDEIDFTRPPSEWLQKK